MTAAAQDLEDVEQERPGEVEVLLFLLGGVRLGADASQVLRIDRPGAPGSRSSPLGSANPRRSLVFRTGDVEGTLDVDRVLGVRAIRELDLRHMPPVVRAARHALGFWLDGDRPVLLVDLPGTLPPPESPESLEANPHPKVT